MKWNGFVYREFVFDGQKAIVVIPDKKVENPVLAVKTEYWNAFPEVEIELLKKGFYLCFIENDNR